MNYPSESTPSPINPDACMNCSQQPTFWGIEELDGEPYELHQCPCGELKQLRTFIKDDGDDYPYRDDDGFAFPTVE